MFVQFVNYIFKLLGGCKEKNSSEVSMTNYIHPEVFSRILDFVYTSRIQISEKCVLHIMSGASMLQMNHVVRICERYNFNFTLNNIFKYFNKYL